jgi:hypothetical protein
VTATNAIGTSVASVASAAVTPSTVPSAPTAVTAVVGDTQATISFTAPTDNGGAALTSYTVTSSPGDFTCTVNAPTTSCIVSGLSNGTAYTFTVKATNANGDSLASTASSSITPAKAPDAPTNVLVVAGTEKITVSWTAPASNGSPITSYTVQAYDSSGTAVAGATCVATAPAVTCDVSANLVAGNQYTFKVTATSTAGTSLASDASAGIAVNAAPSPPINVTAIAGNVSATVSWDAPINTNGSAITGYTVTAYTLGNVASGTCITDSATTTCSISGLTNGVEYIFRAVATNNLGTSAESVASAPATPSTVPNPPTSLTVAVGNTEATISFTAPVNDGGSPVTIYTVTGSNGRSATGTSSPIEMVGLTNGTAYTFTVKATNKNGDSVASVASNPVTPADTFAPTLSSGVQPTGKPYVGLVLTSVMTFNGAPDPTLTYQWKSCTSPVDLATCTNITGATSRTLLLTSAEEGQFVVVTVVATNSRGSTDPATSDPTEVINPAVSFIAPSGTQSATAGTPFVLSLAAAGGIGAFTYTVSAGTMPAGVSLDPATGQISGAPTTAGTYTFTVRAADSNGVFKEVIVTITVAAAPANAQAGPRVPIRNAEADRAAADALAKAAADKAAADKAVAEKVASDTAATTASTKAAADVAAAVAAATAAVEKAAAAAVAQAAADAAAARAEVQAKAAADARAAATKAAADAQAAIRNSTTTAAAKAAATKSANTAAAAAAAAVRAAATAAQQATKAKATAANANKQVDIAINSLNSKTAASQASEQANAIAAAAKAAANEAAAAAATKAAEARATAAAAQKTAVETAARIATEQKAAADAAARAKLATDAAAKATADKIAATEAARVAAEASLKILSEKAALAEQAVKATTETAREEINRKIEEVSAKAEEAQKVAEVAATKADAAAEAQATAVQVAESATKDAQTQAAVAVDVKAESVTKTAAATKAAAAATVAAKVAAAAKAAAAKVPSKAVIVPKPSTSTNKNSAKATVTGLKPGQKVKVTVNVKPRP